MWSLISRLTSGKPDQISIMILDGQTVDQVRAYIEKIPEINHITTKMTDQDLVAALKLDATSMEGFLYPSTYYIAPGQTDLELYQHSVSLMKARLLDIYNTKNQYTTYKNPYQMLIMASLIHKETANLNDLYLVSTVFNNRIRDKFKLQDDPSVFYGLRKYGKPVLQKRFQFDTPYNTYLHTGLPPTPICIPSINALKAAANPYNNPRLYYFVAIGSGKTKFSTSYNEHLNSVYKYLKNTKNNTTTNANNNVNRNVKKTTKNNYNSDKKKQKNNNHTINSKNNDIQF